MQTVIPKVLNLFVMILSVFFAGIAILFIFVSLTPSMGITYAIGLNSTGAGIRVVLPLFLLGATVYYFKTNQAMMKIISSVGCVSMFVILLIVYLQMR